MCLWGRESPGGQSGSPGGGTERGFSCSLCAVRVLGTVQEEQCMGVMGREPIPRLGRKEGRKEQLKQTPAC